MRAVLCKQRKKAQKQNAIKCDTEASVLTYGLFLAQGCKQAAGREKEEKKNHSKMGSTPAQAVKDSSDISVSLGFGDTFVRLHR